MNKESSIVVFGHTGLVGSAIVRRLQKEGYENIIVKSKELLDLRNQAEVNSFFDYYRPEYIFLVAATVGGIKANNTRRAEFIYDNTMIQSNVIHASYLSGVKKLLFTGSACIYPKFSKQPITEDCLLTGELEPTNEPYAIAKLNGIKMCQAYNSQYGCNFITTNPNNIYGVENENFNLESSHVLPALIRKFIVAKEKNTDITIWGTGTPRREFIHADDLAEGLIFLMQNYNGQETINIGSGIDYELNEVAEMVDKEVDFKGRILHDTSQPDGMKLRLLDVSKMNELGWRVSVPLQEGLKKVINEIYKSGKHLEWLK